MRSTLFLLIGLLLLGTIPAKAGITITGLKQPEETLRQATYYARLFGFDSTTHILIVFSASMEKSLYAYTLFEEKAGIKQLYISIDSRLPPARQGLVLAHEMVHARQFVSGDLQHKTASTYRWKGHTVSHAEKIPYHSRGWEQEAHALAQTLYSQYKKHQPPAPLTLNAR